MGFFKSIGKAFSSVGHAVSNGVGDLWNGVQSVANSPLVQGVGNMGKNILQGVGNTVGGAIGYDNLGTQVGQTLSGGYHAIRDAIAGDGTDGPNGGLMGGLSSTLGGISSVRNAWEEAFNRHPDGTVKSASEMGIDTRNYLANAFPELNPWERSGAGGSMAGIQSAVGMANQNQIVKAQLANAVKLKKMDNETALKATAMNNETALQSTAMTNDTATRNVDQQMRPALSLLPGQMKKLEAEIRAIDANTSLTPERRQQLAMAAVQAAAGGNLSNQQAANVVQQTRLTTQQANTYQGQYSSQAGKMFNDANNILSEAGKQVKEKFSQGISSGTAPRMSSSQIKRAYANGQGKSSPYSLH
ncbi:hypothetical protein [Pectobacterium phage Mimer]|nr:pilot protein [Pectobacterium phage Mimer]